MTINPKNHTTWRDRLQLFAQMAAIGSFMAALIIASLAIANYRRLTIDAPIHRLSENTSAKSSAAQTLRQ